MIRLIMILGLAVTLSACEEQIRRDSRDTVFRQCVEHSGRPTECINAVNQLYPPRPPK